MSRWRGAGQNQTVLAVFFAFMSRKSDEIIAYPKYKIKTVRTLTTDWYTSVKSSSIL